MKNLYRRILRLYPEPYRSRFSGEMLSLFEQLWREHRERSKLDKLRFLAAECGGLLLGVCAQHLMSKHSAAWQTEPMSKLGELAAAEQCVRFHLNQTVDGIAHHQFERARFHAREEELARAKLKQLQAAPGGLKEGRLETF